jgi:hypothetical protein
MILGKSGVELGLHGSRVLPRLQKLILQCFSPEHRVTKALQHVGLLAGPLHNVLHRQHTSTSTQQQRIDHSEAKATYLHPLLSLADRLQVPGHRRRVNQVIREQLHSATTTRGSFRHWRRADGLRVLDLRGADSHLQSNLWWHGGLLSSGRRGGFFGDLLHWLGGSLSSLRRLWCRLLHRHCCRDVAPFGLDTWQEDVNFIGNYDYSMGETKASVEYSPSTTLASGNTALAAGTPDSA